MKKIILSLLLVSTMVVLAGCGNKESAPAVDNTNTATTSADGMGMVNFKEEKSTDANGNEVITRTFEDGRVETEVHEGNKVIRTNKHPDGHSDKSTEEFLEDGTRLMTHIDPEGRLHKFTEKDLGNGKREMRIENQLPDGTMEIIDELHEELSEGKHKMTQKYQDGRVQVMLMTHNGSEDKNETEVTYPDGRVEKTIETFYHQPDGSTKVVKTNPDGTKEENVYKNEGQDSTAASGSNTTDKK